MKLYAILAFCLVAGASAGPYGSGVLRISSSADCAAVGGSCDATADCDLSSNVFVGSCDDANLGCCIYKDDVCEAKGGECLSEAECNDKSDYRATGLACNEGGVCCVAGSSSGSGRNDVELSQGQSKNRDQNQDLGQRQSQGQNSRQGSTRREEEKNQGSSRGHSKRDFSKEENGRRSSRGHGGEGSNSEKKDHGSHRGRFSSRGEHDRQDRRSGRRGSHRH